MYVCECVVIADCHEFACIRILQQKFNIEIHEINMHMAT